jgi:DNA-binding NtrC family response regulator
LRNASAELTAGDWPGAVRESIHAVEAAAKLIEQTADTLGPALAKLQTSIGLNPILKSAFGQLYGYSCKDGARHALVFEAESTISERDALFMFGACAAFVGYLLSATPMVAK